jgi:Thioredoxin domain
MKHVSCETGDIHVSPEEKKQIRGLNRRLKQPLDIKLKINRDSRSEALEVFSKELSQQASNIHVAWERAEAVDAMPELHVSTSIIYRGVPHGTELEPFLDLLANLSEQNSKQSPLGSSGDLHIPAMLKLYVSGMCTFCPAEVKRIIPLALQNAAIRLTIIDAVLFSDVAESDHIRSVPTLILDDQFRWTGRVDTRELRHAIQHRDPSHLSAATLESMIAEGNTYQLSDMIIDLLTHEAFSTRLGAMAAAEEIAERQTDLAAQMTMPLIKRFEQQPDVVKGDILYILGAAGDEQTLDFLDKILSENYDAEVREAAAEAVETIHSRLSN